MIWLRIQNYGVVALAGTTFPIDRQLSSDLLEFKQPYTNSLDAVSDRDFILEFLSNASILMMHMSRFCEEMINWCSFEYQFITLSDTFTTGSSIMPQKKNPDMTELIRGKTGRVYGHLFGLLTVMKSLPLAYNKDLQEDKEGMFDTVETILNSLDVLADYLAGKGLPFREAHEVVGRLVLDSIKSAKNLQDWTLEELQTYHSLITEDIYVYLQPKTAVQRRNSLGGTGFDQVEYQIAVAKKANEAKK